MPTVASAANDRRCYDYGCHHNWRRRCDYDWPVRATMSIRTAVKTGTTSALSTGVLNGGE